jgi:heparan-alpha-glucosaminide N-acetyltransferase
MSSPTAPATPAALPVASGARLESLDAFRGLIMFSLLCGGIFHSLKGHPFWNWLFLQNEHVAWEGCVYWDLIQPSFLFMVGVAMPFAFARREAAGDTWTRRLRHALVRAFNLTALGFFLDHFGAERIQPGFIRVLQQIAIAYLLAFFLVGRPLRTQGLAAGAILVGYQLLWMFNPWNGPGGPWAQGGPNLGTAFDFWMLGRNYSGNYVGLNAVPATATILFGVMAGTWIQANPPGPVGTSPNVPSRTLRPLLIAGAVGIGLGLVLGRWFPLIKRIWTPSFTVYSGGWSCLILALLHWAVDLRGWRRMAFPLVVVGTNSIAAYVLANVFGGWFKSATSVWIAGLNGPLGPLGFPIFQRALFAAAAWGVLYWLWKRRLFFKL